MNIAADAPNPHFPIRPEWLAMRDEPAIEPGLPIIDSHHHFWDRRESRYFFFDLLDDLDCGHDVRATVFMECGAMLRRDGPVPLRAVGETEFANGCAAMAASGHYGDRLVCAGIIGYGDLALGDDLAPVLEAHAAAGGGRYRGIRQIAAWHPDPAARGSLAAPPPDLLTQAAVKRGLAAVGRAGLSFDAYVYHTQLRELAALARSVPDVPIIVNHVGGAIGIGPYAGHREEVFARWRDGIAELAACPNVMMKLTGLGMRVFGFGFGDRPEPPTSEDLAKAWTPLIATSIELFGAQRCLFGSNFPVDKGTCSYGVLWNAFKRIVVGASDDEKAALFGGTAKRVYLLDEVAL
jgi:L-fuconolactonase